MRAREFLKLFENEIKNVDSLDELKKVISSKIKDLPPTKETIKMLQEIEDLLQHVGAGGKLGLINDELDHIDDPSVKKAQKMLAKYINSIDMTKEQRSDLFKRWKDDKLIDKKLLLSPGKHSIVEVINGYESNPAIKELTDDLAQVAALGQGKGEFLLSVFSKSITKMQKGDLMIDGHVIELKTLDVGGGRFYDQEVRPSAGWQSAVENFRNTWSKEINAGFPGLASSGLKINDLIALSDYVDSSRKTKFYNDIKKVLTNIFPGISIDNIINAIRVGNENAAKQAYALANLDYYRGIKTEDYGILYIDLTTKPTSLIFFKDAGELTKGGLRLHAKTFYPITDDPRNAYPQITIVTTKQGLPNTDAPSLIKPLTKAKTPKKASTAGMQQPTQQTPGDQMTPGIRNQRATLATSKVPMGQEPQVPDNTI